MEETLQRLLKAVAWLLSPVLIIVGITAYLYGAIGGSITPSTELFRAPLPMPDGLSESRRVVFLGTSLTYTGDWVEEVGRRLQGCPKVELVRLAKPGSTSAWGVQALRNYLDSGQEVDLLVVEFSINDAAVVGGAPLAVSRSRHAAILDMLPADTRVVLATMSPAWGEAARRRPGQARYQALYRDLAEEYDVGLIDTVPLWLALSEEERKAWVGDGLHPSEESLRRLFVPVMVRCLTLLLCPPSSR